MLRYSHKCIKLAFCFGFALVSNSSAQAQAISVPSDSANYELLDLSNRADGTVEITTKRQGKSGESYSKRLVDCKNWTAKYLGDGDSLDKMKASKPDAEMWPLTKGSISSHIAAYACKHSK
ncbi:hypothetical protein [Thalassospira lucentensis]|uniref:hypothetical protein n=1 Tax=Thalassospira lucentensis TaxID=168935 RepID=UPI003AA8AB5D